MKPVRCACDSGDSARTMPRLTVTTNLQAGHRESGMPVPQRGHRNRICAGLVAAAGCMRAPVADSGRKDRRFHGGADGIHDVHAWYRSRQPAQDTPAMTHTNPVLALQPQLRAQHVGALLDGFHRRPDALPQLTTPLACGTTTYPAGG